MLVDPGGVGGGDSALGVVRALCACRGRHGRRQTRCEWQTCARRAVAEFRGLVRRAASGTRLTHPTLRQTGRMCMHRTDWRAHAGAGAGGAGGAGGVGRKGWSDTACEDGAWQAPAAGGDPRYCAPVANCKVAEAALGTGTRDGGGESRDMLFCAAGRTQLRRSAAGPAGHGRCAAQPAGLAAAGRAGSLIDQCRQAQRRSGA